jgi:hypothetical protein
MLRVYSNGNSVGTESLWERRLSPVEWLVATIKFPVATHLTPTRN